jgi:hypothetical protein
MRSTIASLAGIATVLLALTFTTAATAAVPGLNLVEAGSGPPNSNASHTATAECPEGQALLGLGGKSEGGGGQVVLDALAARTNHSATVRGHEDQDGTSANWAVKAFAICADDGGERRTTFNEVPNSLNPKFATTADGGPCTGQRRLTGVGGEIPIGATGQVMLDAVIPSADLETASVRAHEDQDGFSGNWTLRPFALCADPLPGLELITATSANDSQNKHVTALCPAGKRVIGTGGQILSGNGQVSIQYMVPDAALTRVHVRGVEDQDGLFQNWRVRAFAICANG